MEPHEEIWVFGGNRILKGDKKAHAWFALSDTDRPLLFSATGKFIVGSEYRVKVTRSDETVSMHGTPEYNGRHDDDKLRARLEADHAMVERRLRVKAMERKDKADSALESALEPVLEVARKRSSYDREIFALYVFQRIMRA